MKANPYPGAFIVIEGIDGSGKSLQVDFIAEWLGTLAGKRARNILTTHEPSDGEFGLRIKEILMFKRDVPATPLALQELYVRDRKEHLARVIIPHLEKEGNIVVCDRYALSTFAYGMASGIAYDAILNLHEALLGDLFIMPDVTCIIDTDPLTSSLRLVKKNGEENLDYFERQREFLGTVARQFRGLAPRFPHAHVIAGDRPIAEVSEAIHKILAGEKKITYTP